MSEHAQGEGSSLRAASEAAVPVPFSGTVTIFFSDIRGFTDYTEEFGDEAASRIVHEQDIIIRSQIEAYGGVVVKTQGDSFMVAFGAARGAILCAIAIQRIVAQANRDQTGPRIAIGIGINTGEPIRQEDGDYIGGTVNLAARICAAAGAGQILVAESTRYVAGRIELRRSDGGVVEYVDLGLHELKGFPEAKRLFEVGWHPTVGEQSSSAEASSSDGEEQQALKAAVQRANGVLTRVLSIVHLDDPAFPSLLECQAKATELRLAFTRAGADRRRLTAKDVLNQLVPFENLMILTVERDTLTDERWAELDGAVARVFGRQLVNAIARGRLSIATAVMAMEKPAPVAPPPPPPVEVPREQPKEPEPAPAQPARSSVAAALAPPPLDERGAGVSWWAAAYAAWSQWKPSGLAWAHALREEIRRYPFLLSVPLRSSGDLDDGRLAGGYFLLLEHVENQSPGFLRTILDRAIGEAGMETRALGLKLYQLLVEGGRLQETYPAFVRDVIQVAVPTPGMWADAGLVEREEATVLMSRPNGVVGEPHEESVQLTEAGERAAERRFLVTTQPLTTRFFYVTSGKLNAARDVEVRLREDGKPSDRAWYLTVRDSLSVRSDPKLVPLSGVPLPGLGRHHFGVWVAVFNPDPEGVVTYELSVSVKRPGLGQSSPAASMFSRPGGPAR
jgi:class 3 adenylate cyclase